MKDKKRWLAIAIHGTRREKEKLEFNLRCCGDGGAGWTRHDAFLNSIKGFRAETVAKNYLEMRKDDTGADFRWTHEPDAVYELGDEIDAEPDGAIQSFDGTWFSMDVKSCRRTVMLDADDGGEHVTFRNAHNAQVIVWVHDSTLTFCRRVSPEFDSRDRWKPAIYRLLNSVDVKFIEEKVDLDLKALYDCCEG